MYSKSFSSKILTIASAFTSMFGMFLLLGFFSRHWQVDEFNSFVVNLRYMGYVAVIASMSLGYSIASMSKEHDLQSVVFPNASFLTLFNSLVMGFLYVYFLSKSESIIFWIVAISFFHIFISSVRVMSFYDANVYTVLLKFFILLVSGLLIINYSLDSFFVVYGLLLLMVMAYILYLKNFQFKNISLQIIKALIGHSWSRLLDNSIRMAYYIVPISYVNYQLGVSEAALLALTLMLLKTLESVLQPLLIQLHILSINNNTYLNSKKIVIYIGVTVICSLIFYLFMDYFGEKLLEFWLGRKEILLLSLLQATIPAIPAILVGQYLKGIYESKEEVSPYLLSNLFNLLLFICAMVFFSSTIQDVVSLFVLFAWVRFLINWSKTIRINRQLYVK